MSADVCFVDNNEGQFPCSKVFRERKHLLKMHADSLPVQALYDMIRLLDILCPGVQFDDYITFSFSYYPPQYFSSRIV